LDFDEALGPSGLKSQKGPGRKPKLTKSQRKELDKLITEGPAASGFPGACWRSPMIQQLILKKFGVFYAVAYIAQLLKNMGFSFQKAKFVSDHKDTAKRKEWLEKKWPEILKLAKEKSAHILFGDEASFPQWGSLTYTWAKKGQQPIVKTSGIRKGYKVFGLIDYFTGHFFCKGHEGRFNSESYASFLKEVMSQTKKHIILIQDGARYHTSKAMKKFFAQHSNRITVYQLPSYSPDYNPIEKLWKKIKEKEIHLHYFPNFDSLKNKVEEALLHFKDLQNEILSLFVFYNELEATQN
jgi:transposase